MSIDLNRGVTQRFHPQGYMISMYKDTPGVYLLNDGTQASLDQAKQAGFPVIDQTMEMRRRELLADQDKRIRQELEKERGRIDAQLEEERRHLEAHAAESVAEQTDEQPAISPRRGSLRKQPVPPASVT